MKVVNNVMYIGAYAAPDLVERFGSPLFVYEEAILRERCRELQRLASSAGVIVNYSCKANGNVALLQIIRNEGLNVDAMSPGEIFLELAAGFEPRQILYIGNNVSREELKYAIDAGVRVSVDSLSQLEDFGSLNPGGGVFVRINPGVSDGHHKKVATGEKGKFGVTKDRVGDIKRIAREYNIKVVGINMHIGSCFLQPELKPKGSVERFESERAKPPNAPAKDKCAQSSPAGRSVRCSPRPHIASPPFFPVQ